MRKPRRWGYEDDVISEPALTEAGIMKRDGLLYDGYASRIKIAVFRGAIDGSEFKHE